MLVRQVKKKITRNDECIASFVCVYVYIYIYTHIYMYVCVYIYTYIYIHIYVCMCVYIYIYTYICMYVCIKCFGSKNTEQLTHKYHFVILIKIEFSQNHRARKYPSYWLKLNRPSFKIWLSLPNHMTFKKLLNLSELQLHL